MHRQKTIAKWLAVILLMTVSIACYVTLSTLAKNESPQNSNVADANDKTNRQNNDASATQNQIYSTLPRKCESVKGATFSHFGGEGEDRLLDTFCFAGKTIVIAYCDSTSYDVKEKGIYAAIFGEQTLEKVVKVAGENATYLDGCQSKNGIVIFARENGKTTVKIYDENFSVSCENQFDDCEQLTAFRSDGQINAFCKRQGKIKSVAIDDDLEISTSNFVLQTDDASVKECIVYGENTLLFLQDGEAALGVVYNRNSGFKTRFSYNKHRILQVMPVSVSGTQTFVTLCRTPHGLCVYSHDANLETQAKYDVDDENCGALFRCESGVQIVCKTKRIRLCSHLEAIETAPLKIDENDFSSLENATDFACVMQEDDLFVARFQEGDLLMKFDGEKLEKIFKFNYAFNAFALTSKVDDKVKTSLFFDGYASAETTYMCFGKTDVFFISY